MFVRNDVNARYFKQRLPVRYSKSTVTLKTKSYINRVALTHAVYIYLTNDCSTETTPLIKLITYDNFLLLLFPRMYVRMLEPWKTTTDF